MKRRYNAKGTVNASISLCSNLEWNQIFTIHKPNISKWINLRLGKHIPRPKSTQGKWFSLASEKIKLVFIKPKQI